MRTSLKNKFLLSLLTILLLTACSTQQNTARSRWWHAFHARYNTYYNGAQAYIEGSLEKENGHHDNYTELLPLYYIGNKKSITIGKNNFDRAIEKSQKAIKLHSITRRPVWDKQRRKTERDIEWLNRKEYNPFLWKAWMLMGRSQFHEGELDNAVSTFSHMAHLYATQPPIRQKAQAWLTKCFVEQGSRYEAEDMIRTIQRDSIHWQAQKEWNYAFANYYIHTGDYPQAIVYLRKVIRQEMRRKQKAREWFLLGQLYEKTAQKLEAYNAYRKVAGMNPPYELEFNARIAMTGVLAGTQQRQMINRLKRMAVAEKNKDFLDQVYYAIGNIYLSLRDTTTAIQTYETGNRKATQAGWPKGVLLQKLGDLYWDKRSFSNARRCYTESIGLLDKTQEHYNSMTERSKVLDELVPFTEAISLQDSLLTLARLPENERNAVIDRAIEAFKKKEKEEKAKENAEQAEQESSQNRTNSNRTNRPVTPAGNINTPNQANATWYFYNPMAVNMGKEAFRKRWGARPNVDNWQRTNKTIVSQSDNGEAMATTASDSIKTATDDNQSPTEALSNEQNPHKREYYLAQIPFTEQQQAESHKQLADALFHAGVIFKDKLDELRLSEQTLNRLEHDYPKFEKMDEAYYHLYLLHARLGQETKANSYIERLKERFKDSKWTTVLTDPYFKENAVFGEQLEDSLYGATYDAFKAARYEIVKANRAISDKRFPMGANRDKFVFIGGLSQLNEGNAKACLNDMNLLLKNYPESKLSQLAGTIINGVKAGRTPHSGSFDMNDLWRRRTAVMSDSDSIATQQLSVETEGEYLYVIVYSPDSLNENQLLFEMARYNFTNYLIRNFELEIENDGEARRMKVGGFQNYQEALLYARQLQSRKPIIQLTKKAHSLIISKVNLELLGKQFSYADYELFYAKHFAAIKPTGVNLLNEPTEIIYIGGENKPKTQEQKKATPQGKPQTKPLELEDEYYDLEGF